MTLYGLYFPYRPGYYLFMLLYWPAMWINMGIQRPERYYLPLTVSNCNAIRERFVVSCQNTANYSQRSITWYRQQALICFLRLTDLSVPRLCCHPYSTILSYTNYRSIVGAIFQRLDSFSLLTITSTGIVFLS